MWETSNDDHTAWDTVVKFDPRNEEEKNLRACDHLESTFHHVFPFRAAAAADIKVNHSQHGSVHIGRGVEQGGRRIVADATVDGDNVLCDGVPCVPHRKRVVSIPGSGYLTIIPYLEFVHYRPTTFLVASG